MGAHKGPGSVISTHALREEGDRKYLRLLLRPRHFYPRPPRGGRLPHIPARDFG